MLRLLAFAALVAAPAYAFAQASLPAAGTGQNMQGTTQAPTDARTPVAPGRGLAGAGARPDQGSSQAPVDSRDVPGASAQGIRGAGTGFGMQGSTQAPVDATSVPR
jgi:PPE-repeat protein